MAARAGPRGARPAGGPPGQRAPTTRGGRWPAGSSVDGERPPLASTNAITVCDPAVGGGAFLLAAADWLLEQAADPTTIVDQLWGIDVDPVAVAVAEAAVALWAWRAGAACGPSVASGHR